MSIVPPPLFPAEHDTTSTILFEESRYSVNRLLSRFRQTVRDLSMLISQGLIHSLSMN